MNRPQILRIIIGSTRPGRIGPAFAEWFTQLARDDDRFVVDVTDLADLKLPFLDEPNHPRLGQYIHQHTKDWSMAVTRSDAFVLVTPEYNHGYSAALKNALDFLCAEWADKPVGFLSYGGISAGTRAVQQLKQVVTTLRMVPVLEAVNIPYASGALDESGRVIPDETRELAARAMLDELARLGARLRPSAIDLPAAERCPVPLIVSPHAYSTYRGS
jgi:NAD(P)H-dependent FMN reductase